MSELDDLHQELPRTSRRLEELSSRVDQLTNSLKSKSDAATRSELGSVAKEGQEELRRYKALKARHDQLCGDGWTQRVHGTMESGEEVTFREGRGANDRHTLIADGHVSGRQFDRTHNHYGPKREGGGYVEEDRGHYTGPGH